MFYKQQILGADIEDAGGEITDEQDLIWQSTDIEIKDKLDSYGMLFDELAAEKKKLAEIKANGVRRVQEATNRVEALEIKLKKRLNYLSNLSGGKPLRGHTYSFHPYESTVRTLENPEQLKPEEAYLTIEIREDYWNELINSIEDLSITEPWVEGFKSSFSIKKRTGKVSELSPEHPAIKTVLTPSVRIT